MSWDPHGGRRLTLGEAARYLGVAESTLRKWADEGKVACFKTPGKHRRFLVADLDEFVESSRPGARPEGPLVLIVDDDARLREFVRGSLEGEGYAVREAGSAEEGLTAVEDEPPALILLDVMLPGIDGWELLRRVQERHGVGAIPVIMFSGKADDSAFAEAAGSGAHGFLGKPFDPQQLIESTKKLVPV